MAVAKGDATNMTLAEPTTTTNAATTSPKRLLRVGFLPLSDAAPLIVAQELGIFTRYGLKVALTREVGWATVREKIIYGDLDASHAPAPMLWDASLGINSSPCPVLTAFVLNLNGNAITLSNRLRAEGAVDEASLRSVVRARRGDRRVTFGVVFPFSSHQIQLRQWLLAAGIQPDSDLRIVVVPPAQMFRNLAAGTIDGYCVGEPWGSVAVRENVGWCPTWSTRLAPGHVEKVLMVTERFATERAGEHRAMVASLARAAAWCDEPQNRERLTEILGDARYLNLPAAAITPPLIGRFDAGHGVIESVPDFHIFHRGEANVPAMNKAEAMQRDLIAARLLPATADAALPRRLFREDLYRDSLNHHQPKHETVSP